MKKTSPLMNIRLLMTGQEDDPKIIIKEGSLERKVGSN